MAAIPTYLYLGDPQINGTATGGSYEWAPDTALLGAAWGMLGNLPRFKRVVPSGADGLTGGTFKPYWDGSLDGGNGAFTAFHHSAAATGLDIVAPGVVETGAKGDNWYYLSPGITPTPLLMNALEEMHPEGFKLLKLADYAGAAQWKSGGTAWNAMMAQWAKIVAAMGSDTPDVRAVIWDGSQTDIETVNLGYPTDLAALLAGIRAQFGEQCWLFIVSHRGDMLADVAPGVAAFARSVNRDFALANERVAVFDMNWAEWGADLVLATSAGTKRYSTESYIQAGARLGRLLEAKFTAVPDPIEGNGIATYAMVFDSNGVVPGCSSSYVFLSNQETLLGTVGGTTREGQYIWNDQSEQVELYDVLANTNTFGQPDFAGAFGPEATLLKRLRKRHPEGVVLLKFAKNGVALTSEAVTDGATGAVEEGAGTIFEDLRVRHAQLMAAVVRDLGRVPDMRGVIVGVGGNDTYSETAAAAFATKAPTFVDSLRSVFTTRAHGELLGITWLQPPPHLDSGIAGGTTLGQRGPRESVRQTIANLPQLRERVRVVEDPGDKYELQRGEHVHVGTEGCYAIGYDCADVAWSLASDEGETAGATTTVDLPSETAAFVVEDGSGLSSANSYCTVDYADTYHEAFGNPTLWRASSAFAKQDALRIATRALDLRFGWRWDGVRTSTSQALAWPRSWATDRDGVDIATDAVPLAVQQATAMLALLHLQGNVLIQPTQDEGDVASESIALPGGLSKSTTYLGGKQAALQLPAVESLLSAAGLFGSAGAWTYSEA